MSFNKKILSGLLVISVLTSSLLLYPSKKAEAGLGSLGAIGGGVAGYLGAGEVCDLYAATAGKLLAKAKEKLGEKLGDEAKKRLGGSTILGGDDHVPVLDESVKKATEEVTENESRIDCKTRVQRTLLSILKKRVLDTMVDQIIGWVKGNGKPRFVTDLGGFLEDAGQAAVGDVAYELGLGELCTGISAPRIQFQLETPVFSQRVSCTLDDIVGNIDRFADSFQSGGFIGYQELLKPQNNRYGVEILTASEAERRKSKKQLALQQEVSLGQGFLGTAQCLEWEARATDSKGKAVSQKFPYNYAGFSKPYPDPSEPPPTSEIVTGGVSNIKWVCSKQRTTTPGRLIAGVTEKSLTADVDYVINADTLEEYAAAIIDAGINRLIQEGVEGVLGVTTEAPEDGYNGENLPSSVQETGGAYTDSDNGGINEVTESAKEGESELTKPLPQSATSTEDGTKGEEIE
jgi:hypothetical protein